MNRLIIESIEGRITLGITMFVVIMILIGWVMINEPYRMASFEEQELGRSTEQGAELFAANCTSCHGTNGQGSGLAPALNNPQLFEYDFTNSVQVRDPDSPFFGKRIADLQRAIRDLYLLQQDLIVERQRLEGELGAEDIDPVVADELTFELRIVNAQLDDNAEIGETEGLTEAQAEALQTALSNNIPLGVAARIEVLEVGTDQQNALLAERDALLGQFELAMIRGYLPNLDTFRDAVPSRDEALAVADEAERLTALLDWIKGELALTDYIETDASRLQQVAWGGDLRGYITTTLIHGRPGSNNVWPGPMVSWSQEGGGPLRRDQIDNIVNYIMNWDKGDDWTIADLDNVQQFARLHADAAQIVAADNSGDGSAALDKPDISALPEGDAANGEALYATQGCTGCHVGGLVGPATAGTWSRVADDRLSESQFDGWTVAEYVYFSIVSPGDYLAEGLGNIMPATFGQTLSDQDIADIMAYLESQ
ncbi:MAG: cytochrome c [Anaerolineae bacterium]|nr:cytochrome c [Anaerolineae bacterium]MDQ7034483.1 cytochrome c [Anaerolineae bacterium]